MNIIINFGLNGAKKEVTWHKPLMDFPKLIRFQGSCWEWAIYNYIGTDCELTFSKIPSYDPNYYAEMPTFEVMFEWTSGGDKCECGSAHTAFPFDHMFYCKKWSKW